jgi:hypothetical protein
MYARIALLVFLLLALLLDIDIVKTRPLLATASAFITLFILFLWSALA